MLFDNRRTSRPCCRASGRRRCAGAGAARYPRAGVILAALPMPVVQARRTIPTYKAMGAIQEAGQALAANVAVSAHRRNLRGLIECEPGKSRQGNKVGTTDLSLLKIHECITKEGYMTVATISARAGS